MFETFLKQWIEKKFKCCVAIISDLHFDRASRVNNEKYEEKCYDQWYVSILSNMQLSETHSFGKDEEV